MTHPGALRAHAGNTFSQQIRGSSLCIRFVRLLPRTGLHPCVWVACVLGSRLCDVESWLAFAAPITSISMLRHVWGDTIAIITSHGPRYGGTNATTLPLRHGKAQRHGTPIDVCDATEDGLANVVVSIITSTLPTTFLVFFKLLLPLRHR